MSRHHHHREPKVDLPPFYGKEIFRLRDESRTIALVLSGV